MYQFLARPDAWIRRCGHLDAALVERRVTGVPPFMRGLRAMFVSDVHVLPQTTQADIDALVDRIAAAAPRLLLLGGDYSDYQEGAERFFKALGRFRPPMGCYGVIGNNDAQAWEGELDALGALTRAAGCELLVNRAARIGYNGGVIALGGVDEHLDGMPDARGLYPDRPLPETCRILLSHYPLMPSVRPDLMLSGHTHGGQFNLLGLTPFSVGFERLKPPRMAMLAVHGMRELDGMKLLVSKGIGASRLQLRVGVRPEIDLLLFG